MNKRMSWVWAWLMSVAVLFSQILAGPSVAGDTKPEVSTEIVAAMPPLTLQEIKRIESSVQSLLSQASAATVNVQIGGANGSGVIVSEDGYVLTAAHVSGRPNRPAYVTFADGRRVRARSLGANNRFGADAGLLKIEEEGKWPTAQMADDKQAKVGDWCFALGYPGGYDKDRGPVLRVGRVINVQENVMWTDCALLGGDSGGPLFDLQGRVIAIHSRIARPTAANFHAPINVFRQQWDKMVAGEVWTGPRPAYLGTENADHEKGAIVEQVMPDSPANMGGVEARDVVMRFAGEKVNDAAHLVGLIRTRQPGDKVKLVVLRAGQEIELEIELGERPDRRTP